jgi:hypothetical protein
MDMTAISEEELDKLMIWDKILNNEYIIMQGKVFNYYTGDYICEVDYLNN